MSVSLFEKRALIGIGLIVVFIGASLYEIGRRNLWFESKNTYYTTIADADGLRVGSVVTMAGLRIGDVADLTVDENNHIAVTINVIRDAAPRIREDSTATAFRAFIIGEKRIEIAAGSPEQPIAANGATLAAKETTELAEFITGKKLAELMGQIESLMAGVNRIVGGVDEVLDKYESGAFNKTFARLDPALENFLRLSDDLIVMTKEMKTKSKELPIIVDQGAGLLGDIRQDLFANKLARDSLTSINKVMSPIAERERLVQQLLDNAEDISRDLKNNPQFGQHVVEALKELTITLKALQKTWILEDKTQAVKAESGNL